jgi:hypothetical protein
MANTYTLISKSVLSATTSSFVLSSIPATYTHLRLLIQNRTNDTTVDAAALSINGVATAGYSTNYMDSNGGGTPRSGSAPNYSVILQASDYGTNLYSFSELTIPNYTGSNEKINASYFNTEHTTSSQYNGSSRSFTGVTSAVTSLTLTSIGGAFVSGTSMYIYGISNS